jgi:hypothetical protein
METKGDKTSRRGIRSDTDAKPQTKQGDLGPDRMAGQNIGARSAEPEHGLRTAFDMEELQRALRDAFRDDALEPIQEDSGEE